MRFTYCFLFAMAIMLPVLAVPDQNVRRRTLEESQSLAENLQDAEHAANDETIARQLHWGWSWSKKKKKKNTRKNKQNRFQQPLVSTAADACECKDQRKRFQLTGFIGNAIEPTPNINQIGGQYIYNSQLSRDEALNEPFDNGTSAFITGACSRFQNMEITPDGNRILGAGLCQFIVSVETPNGTGSMILQGELFDVIPSTFAITGGTGDFDGARGTVAFRPFYQDGESDVFTQAVRVELGIDAQILNSIL